MTLTWEHEGRRATRRRGAREGRRALGHVEPADRQRRQDRRGRALGLHLGGARRGPRRRATSCGTAAPRASCSTCAATVGGSSTRPCSWPACSSPTEPSSRSTGATADRRVYRASGGAIPRSVPVDVLVDEGTASASEIVAGAIQDRKRGEVVGTRTFGKGVFQEVRELRNGGALDITVGEYFLPSGRNLGGGGTRRGDGIKPDVAGTGQPPYGSRRGAPGGAAGAGGAGPVSPTGGATRRPAREAGPLPHRHAVLRVRAPDRGRSRPPRGRRRPGAPAHGRAGARPRQGGAADRASRRRARRARGDDA